MSELGDIAAAVSGLLASLQSGGNDVFAAVEIQQAGDRKAAAAAIARRLKPAALVVYDGRAARRRGDVVPGAAELAVLVAAENLRGGAAALTGDTSHPGGFHALEAVCSALDGVMVEGEYRLSLQDERQVAGDERAVVFEQRYRVERLAEVAAPTFGGSIITGGDSVVAVQVGSVTVESVEFGFAGIDGIYRHQIGTRGRPIRWEGQLVADDDAGLNALEAELERLAVEQGPATMVDSWGRSYPECVLEALERRGARRRHPVTGKPVQAFALVFTQLCV